MKILNLYKHPDKGLQGLRTVKQGFCWPAFFFGWIWAFYYEMWSKGILIYCILGLLDYFTQTLQSEGLIYEAIIVSFTPLIFIIFIGFKGNKWKGSALIKRGFILEEDNMNCNN